MNAATLPEPSIFSEVGAWEIVLFAAGVLFTLVLLAIFITVMVRASREKR